MKTIEVTINKGNKAKAQVVAGIAAGTKVMTLDGEMPVEFLTAGDRVITRDTGMAVLKNVRTRKVACDVIHVSAGSIGHNRPETDVALPSGQEVLIRDWRAEAMFGKKSALVTAAQLVDGEYVRAMGKGVLTVYELEFDTDHIIYAGGLEMAAKAAQDLATAC
ncbi:Hint domain-containing protein [Pseudooceanicola nitratireducens]|uniref:Hint domain-containing protein n=1 Tax=Pseudooceanicola nitratireducens TaxID=517719 RepID=UPI001C95F5FB|nr:Hint domain-containing protein [Pseudooceanicola nitratireducens]MBY6157392.1 Hint domain-containing protein [Pseudooceanicola nitratireducens]